MQNSIARWMAGKGDHRQQLRLRRFFIAFASYAMWYLLAVVCWRENLLAATGRTLVFAGIGILLSQAAIWLLLRSGLNLRFRDPSLTLPQIFVALGWALLLIAESREIRGIVLSVYMVILLFGILALGKRQFLVTGMIAFSLYAALVFAERAQGLSFFSDGYYAVSLLALGCVLLWTSVFGAYVSDLRHKLKQRNDELERVLAQMRELADRDDLTGLHNRRVIMNQLHALKARADRTGETFSVCLIDLDKFKDVNDAFGHLAGDRVLAGFAESIAADLRAMDSVGRGDPAFGRYGGEEFILLLPGTSLAGAEHCAERLRRAQAERRYALAPQTPGCTLSAGIAEYQRNESIESLLRRADHALYAAKRDGRNRVAVASA